jgi:hypothetical protein
MGNYGMQTTDREACRQADKKIYR